MSVTEPTESEDDVDRIKRQPPRRISLRRCLRVLAPSRPSPLRQLAPTHPSPVERTLTGLSL